MANQNPDDDFFGSFTAAPTTQQPPLEVTPIPADLFSTTTARAATADPFGFSLSVSQPQATVQPSHSLVEPPVGDASVLFASTPGAQQDESFGGFQGVNGVSSFFDDFGSFNGASATASGNVLGSEPPLPSTTDSTNAIAAANNVMDDLLRSATPEIPRKIVSQSQASAPDVNPVVTAGDNVGAASLNPDIVIGHEDGDHGAMVSTLYMEDVNITVQRPTMEPSIPSVISMFNNAVTDEASGVPPRPDSRNSGVNTVSFSPGPPSSGTATDSPSIVPETMSSSPGTPRRNSFLNLFKNRSNSSKTDTPTTASPSYHSVGGLPSPMIVTASIASLFGNSRQDVPPPTPLKELVHYENERGPTPPVKNTETRKSLEIQMHSVVETSTTHYESQTEMDPAPSMMTVNSSIMTPNVPVADQVLSQEQNLRTDPKPTTITDRSPLISALRPFLSSATFTDLPNTDPILDQITRQMPLLKIPPLAERGTQKRALATLGGVMELDTRVDALEVLLHECQYRLCADLCRSIILSLSSQILSSPIVTMDQLNRLFRLWFIHLVSLIKLNMIDLVLLELDRLGEMTLKISEFSDLFEVGTHDGPLVSWELKVLRARAPAYLAPETKDPGAKVSDISGAVHTQETLQRLYTLVAECRRWKKLFKDNTQMHEIWETRERELHIFIAGHLLDMGDYVHAHQIVKAIGQQDLVNLLELHIGNTNVSPASDAYMQLSLSEFAKNDTISASGHLVTLLKSQATPINPVALNNLAIMQFYDTAATKAVQLLEGLVRGHTDLIISNNHGISGQIIVGNLSTLCDMVVGGDVKKRMMVEMVATSANEGFDPAALRI